MTTILPNALSGDFNDALYSFLKTPNVEGSKSFVYCDSKGIPTLGVGYALIIKGSNEFVVSKTYMTAFANAGITLTASQTKTLGDKLKEAADALNSKPNSTNPFSTTNNILDWTITDDQAKKLAESKFDDALIAVKNWLGNETLYNSLLGSKEMLALASLAYNGYMGSGKSPKLRNALLTGNRSEAWYEIRYGVPDSNKARHFAEAAIFGLCNRAGLPADEDEAKSVYRMFTQHRQGMIGYENANKTGLNNAKAILVDGNNAGLGCTVQILKDELTPAADILKGSYIKPEYDNTVTYDPLNIQVAGDQAIILRGEDNTTLTGARMIC